ncbi:MAG: two-component regulator propeller domain-containing protein, partial [Bacteroidota bacterium]
MKKKHRTIIKVSKIIRLNIQILFVLLFMSSFNHAQEKPVRFDRLTTRDGLSQNKVFDIVQDKLGFIWIATEDGLNRYDGYKFKVIKKIPGDSTSLRSNMIRTIHITESGDLWLGGALNGLSKFNYETESFTNYINDHSDQNSLIGNSVIDISEDVKGNLWIATGNRGFDYLDVSTNKFYHMANILPPGYEMNIDFLSFIHQDNEEHLWIGGFGKVHIFSIAYSKNGMPRLKPVKVKNQNFRYIPSSIEEDDEGNVWIGTNKEGLFLFDRSNNVLNSYKIKGADQYFKNLIMMTMESDQEGNLWIGGLYSETGNEVIFFKANGVMKIDLKNRSFQNFEYDPKIESSVGSNDIMALHIDRTGVLWIGTFLAGVSKYDKSVIKFKIFENDPDNPNGLQAESIRGFYEDENGKLWIGSTDNGLISYDRINNKYNYFQYDPNSETTISSNITSSIYDDGKYLWVGTFGGLNRFDKRSETFKRFYVDSVDISSIVNSVTYNFVELEDQPGYLWYGSNGAGLVKFNKNDFSFKTFTYDPEDENSLNNRDNFVRTVWYSKSRPNELWTGTTHGINIFNLETETFRYYVHDPRDTNSLSHQNVMHFYEDENGYVWVSTYGGGLNRFNPKTEKFLRFTEGISDLPNNGVYGVLPDDEGNLWMSSNNGISRFNTNTFEFRNYSVDDGLQSEEFNGGSLYKSPSGEMYFGGINGFNSFYPSEVVDNEVIPEIVITDLKIFNESIEISEDSPLKKQISNTEEITLSHWQNDISFEYVALHYANPSKNKYAFKLENYEDEWRYVDNIRIATYTNLDHGEYIFRVKGSNNDGLWNNSGKSIKLVILPPWWKTNWAYLGYFLFMFSLIFTFDRIQRIKLLNKEKRKAQFALLKAENERKTQELEEARQLQLSMLPKELPQLPHLDIAVYMKTATEVGGDYYDFHIGMDGILTVVLGDATGHGMRAGTMVTTTKSLFNVLAPNPNIVETFHEMTRCLKLMHLEKLSMCMTMLKIAGSQVQMSAAGMPPVFIYKRESQAIEEHVMKGMPLGTFSDFPYTLIESEISTGDTILMMSDGFPELMNEEKEMFGYKQARNLFEELAGEQPEEIISKLKDAGSEWVQDKEP